MLKQFHKLITGAGVAQMMYSSTTGGASNMGAVLNTGEADSAGRVGPNLATSKISAGFIWPPIFPKMSTFSPPGLRLVVLSMVSGFATCSLVPESRVISQYRPPLPPTSFLNRIVVNAHVADREYSVLPSQSAILRTVQLQLVLCQAGCVTLWDYNRHKLTGFTLFLHTWQTRQFTSN